MNSNLRLTCDSTFPIYAVVPKANKFCLLLHPDGLNAPIRQVSLFIRSAMFPHIAHTLAARGTSATLTFGGMLLACIRAAALGLET